MSTDSQGKSDVGFRPVSEQEAVVIPERAPATDESPTVISKAPPIVPGHGSSQEKVVDLGRKQANPEALFAGLRGRRLAHYELIEPIGVGGMAAVIRARDAQLDRFVALKILPPEMALEPDNIQRFHQEAKAAAKLDHENIARVFFCGEDQGLHFIAFEFVEGKNLRTLMEERGRIQVAEAVRYILQVATGLEHATTRGVVHRDVKPSNIIITPTGRAKLVDMGLARNLERRGDRDLTQSGVTLGTFDYISPEQALEPRDADARSDVYSLGCTFYHLLTGQPPVPEGTPAKKLQHHQTKSPIDPRAFDPTIPDEIVMILGTMMAKNPKDRYQRPIHLVHHLMQVAQKVGAANDIPEGVLLVDAPLPSQPHSRPLLYIGLALASLFVLTLLASLTSDPARITTKGNGFAAADAKAPPKKDGELGPTRHAGPPTSDRPAIVHDAKELKEALDDRAATAVKLSVEDPITLENTGLLFHGGREQRLKVDPVELEGFASVRFQYKSIGAAAGILLDGGKEVEFTRIHFHVDSAITPPEKAVAAIVIRNGVETVTFRQCMFTQAVPKFSVAGSKKVRLASVLVDTAGAADDARPPVVNLLECYFDGGPTGGQVAVALNGPAIVNVTNCAFKLHSAWFHVRKASTREKTILTVQQSAGFIVFGPAFRFDEKSAAQLTVNNSVFSRPNELIEQGSEPDLMYLADAAPIQYFGDHNIYHNLNAFVGNNIYGEQFQKFLALGKGRDQNAKYLDQPDAISRSPWQQTDPLTQSGEAAFQLKAEYHHAFGLKKTWTGNVMSAPPAPLAKGGNPAPKLRKVVDADDDGRTPGVYAKLNVALADAKHGDVIYLRHGENSRDVVVSEVKLAPGITVTLKPDTDYQPRLILNKKFRDKETYVFKIQDGKLEIEGMEIVLDPNQRDVTQSIVQMGPEALCVFKNCVFTLRSEKEDQWLSVVSSVDLNSMMKSEAPLPPATAKVEFQECLIRGKGDLVALNGCRLLHVEMKNSLVALDGSLLDIEAGNKAMPMMQGVRWRMERSSIFTTESVFALRTKLGKVLTKTQADVEGCLLASLRPDQVVVERDRELDIGIFLEWKGEQNYYANFDKSRTWIEQETRSDHGKLALPKLTEKNMTSLWEATPDWFKAADAAEERMIQGFGQPVDAEKRMMQSLNEPEEP